MIKSIRKELLLRLLPIAVIASALLVSLLLFAFERELRRERSLVAEQVVLLLHGALENAMLKRDVPGLSAIVDSLGRQNGVVRVLILEPGGEVRFASDPALLGQRLDTAHGAPPGQVEAVFMADEHAGEILRSVNVVANREPCQQCHGTTSANPVNGVLIVDYSAQEIRQRATLGAAAVAASGAVVLLLTFGVLWFLLDRRMLLPIARITSTASAWGLGRLDQRIQWKGEDELGQLATQFNHMAGQIENLVHDREAHNRFLQQLLDGLPDGVRLIRQSDYSTVLANKAFEQQTGHDRAAILGHPCHWASHGREHPCIGTMVVCPIEALRDGNAPIRTLHRHVHADGQEYQVEVNAIAVELQLCGHSERFIVESIRDLRQVAQISQEQRLSELGLLAAGVAHEIHNPLASIRMGVQGLLRDVRALSAQPSDIEDYLELIDGQIDACVDVTQRLLLLVKRPEEQLSLVDAARALSDTLQLLSYDATLHGIAHECRGCDMPVTVFADDSDLRMALLNLVQNAHHAMPEGGKVTGRIAVVGDETVVEIIDDGVGIPEALRERIFDPFFSHRANNRNGTGLGLTIVRSVVERAQGRIEIDSEPGRGTCFRLIFPRAITLQ